MRKQSMRATQVVHGLTNHPLYTKWDTMKSSAYNNKSSGWASIGRKGIKVFQEWNISFVAFYNWAIENGWKEYSTLRRKDLEKDFTPDNCFFVEGKKRILRVREKVRKSFNNYW